ncbi:MAG: HPF/RaiA family ribosome-associated protein [Steroidobacteraceae bacterium]
MHVKVRSTLRTSNDQELQEHIQRRLGFSLSQLDDHVRSIHVLVHDINGSRGGMDKSCTVQIQLMQAPTVVIKDMDNDFINLIDRVADRAGRVALRSLQRRQLSYRTPSHSYMNAKEVSI